MNRIFFGVLLFVSFTSILTKGQGVSSSYIIDSVLIEVDFNGFHAPQSPYGTARIDSFDVNKLIRSSYYTYRSYFNYPTFRIVYKYSDTKCLLSQTNEKFDNNKWVIEYDNVNVYDYRDRKIKNIRTYYNYINTSSIYTTSFMYLYEYTNQNQISQLEYQQIENGMAKYGSRQKLSYDSMGRLMTKNSEQWHAQSGYQLDFIYTYEYNSNDSLKASYEHQIYLNNANPPKITKKEFHYNASGFLDEEVSMLLDSMNQIIHVFTPKYNFYDALNRKVKSEIANKWQALFVFNANGALDWKSQYAWDDEDSIWYSTDSIHYSYNYLNQLINIHTDYGIMNLMYDSTGFNNYFEYTGNNDDGTVYRSYKKLLHGDAIPEENSFTLFPNPSNGNFQIIYNSTQDEALIIRVVNNLGQVIFQKEEEKQPGYFSEYFNLDMFSSGIYFFQIIIPTNSITQKILIKK